MEALSQRWTLVPTRHANGNGHAAVLDPDDPAARLDEYLLGSRAFALHGLRLPDGGGKLSHLVIGPAGITVIDSRNYGSRRAKVGHRGLRVGRRNRTDLVKGGRAHVLPQACARRRVGLLRPITSSLSVGLGW